MNRPEQRLQLALAKWWSLAHHGFGVPEQVLFHVPNGGKRHIIEAKILKGMGVRPGVPDLLCIVPSGIFNGLALELKAPDGRLSVDQGTMLNLFEKYGWARVIAWSFDEAVGAITNYFERGDPMKKRA